MIDILEFFLTSTMNENTNSTVQNGQKIGKILVTGAGGFIGHHVTKRLIAIGYNVLATDCSHARQSSVGIRNLRLAILKETAELTPNLDYREANIESMDQLEALWDPSITHVIHLAAQAGVRDSMNDPVPFVAANARGHFNMLELTRKHNVSHLVYASSSSVYGKSLRLPFQEDDSCDTPVSLYAATKKAGELMTYSYSHLYGLKATGLRFFTVYGPWGRPDMAVYSFTKDIDEGKEITVFNNGENKRSFTYIDDVVDGILAATFSPPMITKENNTPHVVYNIGTTEMVTTNKLVELIESNLNKKATVKYMEAISCDMYATLADLTNITKNLGYKPKVQIEEGITKYVEWYKEFKHMELNKKGRNPG